jgi:hypothetical protein
MFQFQFAAHICHPEIIVAQANDFAIITHPVCHDMNMLLVPVFM